MLRFRFLISAMIFLGSGKLVLAQNILASSEFEAENAESVYISGRFCDVEIKTGSSIYFKGVIEGRGDEGDYEITSRMEGSELVIRVERNTRSWDRIERSKLELTVVPNVRVRINNSSGDVYAYDISADEFEFETSSGDIELRSITGDLQVGATSGDIDMEDITGVIEVTTTSGDLNIDGFKGSLDCKSTSGDIEVSQFEGDIIGQSTSGNIDLSRGTGLIDLRATSGDIEGYAIEITGDSRLKASSGDIELEFVNDIKELSFDLQTSSGNLSVGSRRADKSLYLRQGGYWVRGVTTSGNQQYD